MTVEARAHESTAGWTRPAARSTTASQTAIPTTTPAEDADIARVLDQRDAAARAHNASLVKHTAVLVGLAVTLVSTGLGTWRWAASRVRLDLEREHLVEQQTSRLDAVEAELRDVEKVMRLERLERAHTEGMLRMILEGQGQQPPDPTPETKAATAAIDEILAE